MSNVFERVATSFGSTWKDQLADEMKAYISSIVANDLIAEVVASAVPEVVSATTLREDPSTPGSYLIGD